MTFTQPGVSPLPTSFADYVVGLAQEIVRNVEAGAGYSIEDALTKTRRLAGALGNADYERWLGYEFAGYPSEEDPEVAVILKRAQLPSAAERRTYFNSSLVVISAGLGKRAAAATHNSRVASMAGRRAGFGGTPLTKEAVANWDKQEKDARHHESVRLQLVQSVLAEVLRYASEVLHRYAYWDTSMRLFERHRAAVDRLLREQAPDVLDKLPWVFERLRLEDASAIMHAMVTMRSIFVALADGLSPPTQPIKVNGETVDLGPDKVLNRLEQLLRTRCSSESRADRLTDATRDLWKRVNAGTHTDLSVHEAQSVVLQCLLVVGETLDIATVSGSAVAAT
ncbi:MAG: AbiTii domain-containing protein [Gemmatimonadaceae bacterium]